MQQRLERRRKEEEEERFAKEKAEAAKFAMDDDESYGDDDFSFEDGVEDLLPSTDSYKSKSEIAKRKEKDDIAKQERRALAAAMPELKKGDIKKYEKAFKKWDEGEGMISSENLKDLLTLTLTGKLKWSDITDEQVEILLEKMGASKEIRTDNGGVVSITKSKFLDGMRSREGIESGEIKLGNSNNRNSGDKDVQETLDLLDASSFGDDSWEMSQ